MRIMLDVALYSGDTPTGRQDIADRQRVTPDYIAQLTRGLVSAGLLATRKGPGGGYLLAKAPEQIRLGDILRALQESISIAPCLDPKNELDCDLGSTCATRIVWVRLTQIVQDYLDALTLNDLLNIDRQMRIRGETVTTDPLEMIDATLDVRVSMDAASPTIIHGSTDPVKGP